MLTVHAVAGRITKVVKYSIKGLIIINVRSTGRGCQTA